MNKTIFFTALLAFCFSAFSEESDQTRHVKYMFNVRVASSLVLSEEQIAEQINMRIERSLNGTPCYAKSELETFVDVATYNRVVIERNAIVAVAVAGVTFTCDHAKRVIVNEWRATPGLEVFEDIRLEPKPVISGGN